MNVKATLNICALSVLPIADRTYKKYVYEPYVKPVSSLCLWVGPPKSMGSIHSRVRESVLPETVQWALRPTQFLPLK
jgi:hypothetical protein